MLKAMEVPMPKALVLGGESGLLGQALVAELGARGWMTSTLGRADGDILNPAFLAEQIERAKPDIVFNTIAWTQVDDAEDNPDGAMRVNRALPDSLARIISAHPDIWLGHFSTDFVFSGYRSDPFDETATPNPVNVYGKTKLAGEQAILKILPDRSCIIRTAWLFGPGRKNFVDTILKAAQNQGSLKVVDDQLGSPSYTPDVAQWSVTLAEKRATGIYHAVNSGQASWCELAEESIQLVSSLCRVVPIPSSEWPQKAKRPSNSSLDNSKLAACIGKRPRCWQQALRDYIFRSCTIHYKE